MVVDDIGKVDGERSVGRSVAVRLGSVWEEERREGGWREGSVGYSDNQRKVLKCDSNDPHLLNIHHNGLFFRTKVPLPFFCIKKKKVGKVPRYTKSIHP